MGLITMSEWNNIPSLQKKIARAAQPVLAIAL
jgi:hypothetical protein